MYAVLLCMFYCVACYVGIYAMVCCNVYYCVVYAMSRCVFSCVVCNIERYAMLYCDVWYVMMYAMLLCMFSCVVCYAGMYAMLPFWWVLMCDACDVAAHVLLCGMLC